MSSLKGEENKKEEESSVSLSSYKNVHLLLLGEACGASFLPWLQSTAPGDQSEAEPARSYAEKDKYSV